MYLLLYTSYLLIYIIYEYIYIYILYMNMYVLFRLWGPPRVLVFYPRNRNITKEKEKDKKKTIIRICFYLGGKTIKKRQVFKKLLNEELLIDQWMFKRNSFQSFGMTNKKGQNWNWLIPVLILKVRFFIIEDDLKPTLIILEERN